MAKIWGPDTCKCKIDRIPGPIATWIATDITCPIHVGLIEQELLEQCLREVRRRTVVRWLVGINYGLTELQTRPLQHIVPGDANFNPNASYFDVNRVLVVIYKTQDGSNLLSIREKQELQDAMNIQSGEGLVIVG